MNFLYSFILAISLFSFADGLKIVVYSPNFGHSHVTYMGKIADTLQLAGHNVTVVQPLTVPDVRGTGCHHAKVIPVTAVPELAAERQRLSDIMISPDYWTAVWTMDSANPIATIMGTPMLAELFNYTCENLLRREDLISELKDVKFDLAITEVFDFTGYALFHKINVTNIVGAQSNAIFEGTCWAIGAPVVPSYIPASLGATGDSGTFWDRVINLLFTYYSYRFQNDLLVTAQVIMDQQMPDAPRIQESMSNMPFLIVNSDPFMDFPRPTLEKIVNIGGIGLKESKPLNEDWNTILNLRPKTVLISFGSVSPSRTMPQAMKDNICEVLKRFPNVTFIWKYESPEDGLAQGIENIILSKWQPQTDLLADPRLSLFITHGGAGSIMESAHFGVPVITVPLFGDQMRNARMMERLGSGVYYEKMDLLNPIRLTNIIEATLENRNLRENAKKLQRLLSKRPFSPQEKLIKTIELAGEFGSMPNLAPSGRKMGFIQYFNLDIMLFGILAIGFGSIVLYRVMITIAMEVINFKKSKIE